MDDTKESNQRIVGYVLTIFGKAHDAFIPYGHDLPAVSEPFAWRPVEVIGREGNSRTMRLVSEINAERCRLWHEVHEWSHLEWAGAMCGEAGEAANVAKKIKRFESGIQSKEKLTRAQLVDMLSKEIGDTYLYLDLLARREGLKLEDCVVHAFNATSVKEGFSQRL